METNDGKVVLKFEINNDFLDELNKIMQWQDGPNKIEPLEHFKNALLLYAQIVEGISKGQTPALIEANNLSALKLDLPNLLILFKHAKDLEINGRGNGRIDLTKTML